MTGQDKRGLFPAGLVLWAVVALAIFALLTWAVATGQLTWSMAVDAREAVLGFVAGYPAVAYAVFIGMFVVMALAMLPVQLWTITFGSMVFGFVPTVITSWFACVLAAIVVFLMARGVLSDRYRKIVDKYLARLEQGFQRNQFLWMLTLRLIPIVPYCIGNVAPAFLGARFAPFVAATIGGVLPFVVIYAYAGDKAASVLKRDTPPDLVGLVGDLFPVMMIAAGIPVMIIALRWFLQRRKAS